MLADVQAETRGLLESSRLWMARDDLIDLLAVRREQLALTLSRSRPILSGMKYRPLTSIKYLPRVFVRTLALNAEHDLPVIADEVSKYLMGFVAQTRFPLEGGGEKGPNVVTAKDLARVFAGILDLPKVERQRFVKSFNTILDGLLSEDFFGTEGQCDPRGDHRG